MVTVHRIGQRKGKRTCCGPRTMEERGRECAGSLLGLRKVIKHSQRVACSLVTFRGHVNPATGVSGVSFDCRGLHRRSGLSLVFRGSFGSSLPASAPPPPSAVLCSKWHSESKLEPGSVSITQAGLQPRLKHTANPPPASTATTPGLGSGCEPLYPETEHTLHKTTL